MNSALRLSFFIVAVALVLTSTACGGDSGPSEEEKARQVAAAKKKRERRKAASAALACKTNMAPLLDELKELDSRLDVGLNYEAYGTALGDVKVAYDEVEFEEAKPEDLDCLTDVGLPLERAFQQYASAGSTWDKCFKDIDCSNDSISGALQKRWSRAGSLVEKADSGLDRLAPQ